MGGLFDPYLKLASRLGLAVFLGITSPIPLSAEPVPCNGEEFSVDAQNPALTDQLCEIAPQIRDKLANCGLIQSRRLVFEIVRERSHSIENCLAWYDCKRDVIRLTDPALYGDLIDSDSPYSKLPTSVLLRNALTHELAHALVTHTATDHEITLLDQEYVAASLELELMESEWREILIADAPVSLPPKEGLIDIWIYGLEPRKFATNAWQHFSLPENGCSIVRRIVRGEATFSGASR